MWSPLGRNTLLSRSAFHLCTDSKVDGLVTSNTISAPRASLKYTWFGGGESGGSGRQRKSLSFLTMYRCYVVTVRVCVCGVCVWCVCVCVCGVCVVRVGVRVCDFVCVCLCVLCVVCLCFYPLLTRVIVPLLS